MRLSHSKINCILSNPMEYYLAYVQGISLLTERSALSIGSAVHWGLEHNTEDLSEYYDKKFKTKDNYTKDQLLSEAMVHGYFKHKEEIFNDIKSYKNEKLEILEEYHELFLTGKLKSKIDNIEHEFVGIIDLLLLTNKGFIIVDYKTSSQIPDWNKYIEQLYRYIYLIKENFPDVSVIKIAVINLRKTMIRQKKDENNEQYLNRLKLEYDINDESYINYHEFSPDDLDPIFLNNYIDNLCKMADMAYTIEKNEMWYINFSNAEGPYGKSDYWDIFYHTPDAEVLYKIEDTIWNEEENIITNYRPCCKLDMQVMDNLNILNKYSKFKEEYEATKPKSHGEFVKYLNSKYITDEKLLNTYFKTFFRERSLK